MARERPKGRWRQGKPETSDRHTAREHFIHKKPKPVPSGPSRGKAKQRLTGGGGRFDPSSSPPQHPSKPFYPAPSLGDVALRPVIGIAVQPLTTT